MKQYLQYSSEELALLIKCSKFQRKKPQNGSGQIKENNYSRQRAQPFQQTKKFRKSELTRKEDKSFQERSTRKKMEQTYLRQKQLPLAKVSEFVVREEEIQSGQESSRRQQSRVQTPSLKVSGEKKNLKQQINELKKGLQYKIFSKGGKRSSQWLAKGRYIFKLAP